LGIYGFYWFVELTNEVGQMSGDPKFRGENALYLTIFTLGFYRFVWAYQLGGRNFKAKKVRAIPGKNRKMLYLILVTLFLYPVILFIAQRDFNEIL
jgi:hypothetical protein